MTKLTLGHSPDSDDAFMFYGLASGHVRSPDIEFEHILMDIQTLNEWAVEGRLDCTAISVHAYAHVRDRYAILTHGASMGDGYGPKIVTQGSASVQALSGALVAIPGEMTSAFLALRLWWPSDVVPDTASPSAPGCLRYRVVPFDRIMDAVLTGDADAGLIIHEGQLTYESSGLHEIVDLGAWWKGRTGLPLPLGVNTIRADLPADVQTQASAALKASIVFGMQNRADALAHALQYSRSLGSSTVDRFVGMYVNRWTVDLGMAGRRAVELLLSEGASRGFVPDAGPIRFVG